MADADRTVSTSPWQALLFSLGSSTFKSEFITALNTHLRTDHCSVLHRGNNGDLRYITSISAPDIAIPELTQKRYLSQYYRLDPDQTLTDKQLNSNTVMIRHLAASEIVENDYRYYCYERAGIIDRLSVVNSADNGVYCFNLYRTEQSGAFSSTDIKALTRIANLLMALVIKHARLAGELSAVQTREMREQELTRRLEQLDKALTERELQVCARILLGMGSEGIALDLGIKLSSVQTYRKRAYSKLQISSQNELFTLSLETPAG